jgi:hypothetical protein
MSPPSAPPAGPEGRHRRTRNLGGICLNWGCIPTKAMLRSAEVFHLMHRAKEFGLKADGIGYDLPAVVARSRAVAKQLSGGIGHLMKKNKVTVVMGAATLPKKGTVSVKTDKGTEDLTAKSSSWPPARARANCRGWRRTATSSGPTSTRWCPSGCRRSCW